MLRFFEKYYTLTKIHDQTKILTLGFRAVFTGV